MVLNLPNAVPHVVVTPNNKITFIVIDISDFVVLNHNVNISQMVLGYPCESFLQPPKWVFTHRQRIADLEDPRGIHTPFKWSPLHRAKPSNYLNK